MNTADRITFKQDVCSGRPCIRGTRIRVKDVLDLVASGVPASGILADYPDLEPEDIKASLKYAAAQLDHPVLVIQPASADELNLIADRMVNAPTVAEAEQLKQRYLGRFDGRPTVPSPAGSSTVNSDPST